MPEAHGKLFYPDLVQFHDIALPSLGKGRGGYDGYCVSLFNNAALKQGLF